MRLFYGRIFFRSLSSRSIIMAFITLLLTALTGCQHLSSTPEPVKACSLDTLSPISQYTLQGKASFVDKSAKDRQGQPRNRFYSADIHWKQQESHYHILLTGPVKHGGISIEGNQQVASASDSSGNFYPEQPPSQLLAQFTGIKIPLTQLSDWVTGRNPELKNSARWCTQQLMDGNWAIEYFDQSGWQVSIDQWTQWGEHWLPKKITLVQDKQKIKLFIYQWANIQAQ